MRGGPAPGRGILAGFRKNGLFDAKGRARLRTIRKSVRNVKKAALQKLRSRPKGGFFVRFILIFNSD